MGHKVEPEAQESTSGGPGGEDGAGRVALPNALLPVGETGGRAITRKSQDATVMLTLHDAFRGLVTLAGQCRPLPGLY